MTNKRKKNSKTSSTSSRLSTVEIQHIVEDLKQQQHRDSTKYNYYAVWKGFNEFFVHLDIKPRAWENRLILYVGHLIHCKKQSATVCSHVSAVKAMLKMNNVKITEDQYVLASLTRACRLKNDQVRTRLPIRKGML